MKFIEQNSSSSPQHSGTKHGKWNSLRMLVLAAVLIPVIASAGKKDYQEAVLLEGPVKAADSSMGYGTATEVVTKNWIIVFKIGGYEYAAYIDRTGGIFASKGPQDKDWPTNAKIQVYFHHRMGSLYADLKSPSGKEEKSNWVFSKKGADGKQLCGKFKCEKTPEDGDD